ncbi:MAG: phenylacetate--CoA ligase family protein [Polyangiaceae bacterium]
MRTPTHAPELLQTFLTTSLDTQLTRAQRGSLVSSVLASFQRVAREVPAYSRLLFEQGIDPASIDSLDAYARLPLMTKAGYVLANPLPDRCLAGSLDGMSTMAMSSGSTGQSVVWPRALEHELEIAYRFEQVLHDAFRAHERRTLAVVCFALGNWVGGMFTTSCLRHLVEKGYPLAVLTPGNNHAEILRVIEELGPLYEQVILLGYPPFVRDVLELGEQKGINWPALHPKLVFAGEVFSEAWRDKMCARIGNAQPELCTASLYGTADGGVLGNETPLSIHIRRFVAKRPALVQRLFGEARLPTLTQYDPFSRYFELVDGTLVISGDNGVPLVRYHIADTGGTMGYLEMLERLREDGFDPLVGLGREALLTVRELPFVWVFGRSDFTVSYYGANVFPENIGLALDRPDIDAFTTGKFVMMVREDEVDNSRLAIIVELRAGVESTPQKREQVARAILEELIRVNSEFANYVPQDHQLPEVALEPLGHPEWFPLGTKHRYTRR